MAGWVYLDSKATDLELVSKWESVAGGRSYFINYSTSADRFTARVSTDGSDGKTVTANNFGAVPIDTWLFLEFKHDNTTSISLAVNRGTPDVNATATGGIHDSSTQFNLGASEGSSGSNSHDGRMQSWGLWSELASTADLDFCFNNGNGRDFDELTASVKINLDWWADLNESSGTRFDSVGSLDLTDNNTVLSANGVPYA